MKKIGLFFGSFNPVHVGHLIIAETVASSNLVDQVWMVVSPQNPFKQQKNLLNQYDRLHLLQLATANNPAVSASNIEFFLPKPSYTIDTLAYLHEKYPNHQFSVIMGEDNLQHFHKWKNYEAILKYYQIIVYPRPNYSTNRYHSHNNVHYLTVPLLEISATYIRKRLQQGQSIRYLVPNSVYEQLREGTWFNQNNSD